MDKKEYLKQKEDIEKTYGKAEYDWDRSPLNESAKKIKELYKSYKSEQMASFHSQKPVLPEKEQERLVQTYKLSPAVPIELTDQDLSAFTSKEQEVVKDYFRNTNLTPGELERPGISRQRIVGLMRSGPFAVLAARVFQHLGEIKVRNAVLKAIDAGDKQILLEFGRQFGILRDQTMNLNVNKPLEDVELMKRLKELGDSL